MRTSNRTNLKVAAAISVAGLGLLVAAPGASAGNGSTTRVATLSSLVAASPPNAVISTKAKSCSMRPPAIPA